MHGLVRLHPQQLAGLLKEDGVGLLSSQLQQRGAQHAQRLAGGGWDQRMQRSAQKPKKFGAGFSGHSMGSAQREAGSTRAAQVVQECQRKQGAGRTQCATACKHAQSLAGKEGLGPLPH
jgi:hypothetical protein